MTKLFATESTKAKFKDVLDNTLPDLKGYDEVHIITEEDFKKFGYQKKQTPIPSDFDGLLRGSQVFKVLQNSTNDNQSSLLLQYLSERASSQRLRNNLGPNAMAIATEENGKPYRVGFVFLSGDASSIHKNSLLPTGLNKNDSMRSKFLEEPKYLEMLEKFTLAHEIGHLVDELKGGIPNLNVVDKEDVGIVRAHGREVAADTYAQRLTKSDKIKNEQPLVQQFFNNRTLTGTWNLMAKGDPLSEHFTTPFLEGMPLEGVPFQSVLKAGNNIRDKVDAEVAKMFTETYTRHPKVDYQKVDPDDLAQSCMNKGLESRDFIEAAYKTAGKTVDKKEQDKDLKDFFSECASRRFDLRTELFSRVRYQFPIESLERKILDNYMNAATEFRERLSSPAPLTPTMDSSARP